MGYVAVFIGGLWLATVGYRDVLKGDTLGWGLVAIGLGYVPWCTAAAAVLGLRTFGIVLAASTASVVLAAVIWTALAGWVEGRNRGR